MPDRESHEAVVVVVLLGLEPAQRYQEDTPDVIPWIVAVGNLVYKRLGPIGISVRPSLVVESRSPWISYHNHFFHCSIIQSHREDSDNRVGVAEGNTAFIRL